MAFKQSNKDRYFRWRRKHTSELIRLGIPDIIVNDNHRFWIAVQEAEYAGASWNHEHISDKDAPELLALLTGFLGQNSNQDLQTRLEMRLGLRQDFTEKTSYDTGLLIKDSASN